MDPNIKNALLAIGLIGPTTSDADAANAWAQYQQQNPAGAQQLLQQNAPAQQLQWLTILGVLGGAVALYFVWQHYAGGKRQVGEFNEDEPGDDDTSPRLHAMSKTLGAFRSFGAPKKKAGCRGRMGKYEFEPERRLEGYRRKAR